MEPGRPATTPNTTRSGPVLNPIAIGLAVLLTLSLHTVVLADTHQAAPAGATQADDALKALEQQLTAAQEATRAAELQRDEALAQVATEQRTREEAAAALAAREAELAEASRAAAASAEELTQLRAALDTAQARVAETEATYAALEAELASARSAASASEAELERLRTQLTSAEADRQALTDQLAAAARDAKALAARADAATAEMESQRATLSSLQTERDALTAELDEARMRLAPHEGGTASVEAARVAAAEATAIYLELVQRYRRNVTPEQRMELEEAAKEQAAAQTFVARVTGARGLYLVRPLDTLAIIATRFYGDSALWPRLHDANRHVLGNPDHVETGLTLVVP